MNVRQIAAFLYTIITFGIVAFQIALALGAPWGSYAMGGAYPGQFPPAMRVGAAIQAVILVVFALVILTRCGIILRKWFRASRWLAWFVVAFSALSLILNLITPSADERAIWAPVAFAMLLSSGIVAFSISAERSSNPSAE